MTTKLDTRTFLESSLACLLSKHETTSKSVGFQRWLKVTTSSLNTTTEDETKNLAKLISLDDPSLLKQRAIDIMKAILAIEGSFAKQLSLLLVGMCQWLAVRPEFKRDLIGHVARELDGSPLGLKAFAENGWESALDRDFASGAASGYTYCLPEWFGRFRWF